MGGGAGFGGFGQQQGGFGGQQQNPSSGVGGFGRPQGGFNNRQGGFGQQAGFNGFNPQQQFQNPYGPPQMQQMYTPYSQMDQNQFGFQQPQAFRDYQQQQQARMFQSPYQQNPYQQNPYQQNPYQQNPYQQNPYQQQFGRQGGFGFGQQPQYTQHPQQQLLQRMGVIPGQPEQQLPQQAQQTEQPTGDVFASPAVMPQEGTPEYQQRMQNMSQAERMRAALDDSGMGRGGYQGMSQDERIRLQQYGMPSTQNIRSIYTPDHYQQQQPRGMTMDMPQYGSQQAGLQQLLAQMQGQMRGRQMPQMAQQAQRAAPPGMERRMGMGGEYFVPAGTPYNPAAD